MSDLSIQNATSDGPQLYHSSKAERNSEGSTKLQRRFKNLFERSDRKKKKPPNVHNASQPASSKRLSAHSTVEMSLSVTNTGFSFENITSLLIHSFSWNHLLRSKSKTRRSTDERATPTLKPSPELGHPAEVADTSCLSIPDTKPEIVTKVTSQLNFSVSNEDVTMESSHVSRLLTYPSKISNIITESRASPSKIAYFQGLQKLRNCEHRRLREILLIHQTITKAHHVLITEGLHPELIQERRNSRFTRTFSPTPTSNSSSAPSLSSSASYSIRRLIPSPLPPPPYQPCDEDDVPLGVLQLGYKRSG